MVLWELGPGYMTNRTGLSPCSETGIWRALWVCEGHPTRWKWLRVGSPEEVTFEMSSKKEQALAHQELEDLGKWIGQSTHVCLGSHGTLVWPKNDV